MSKRLNWLLMVILLTALAACGSAEPAPNDVEPPTAAEGELKTLYVGPELVDCVGVGPMQCMQVKENPADPYSFFYQQIEGFTFEPGFEYELLVRVTTVENPPADGSSLSYALVSVVNQTPMADSAPPAGPVARTEGTQLVGTLWQMQSYGGNPALAGTEVTAVFTEEGTLGGSSGCNSYSTSYTVDGNNLSINGAIASTMMACLDDGVMEQEAAFLAALPTAATYQVNGAELTLFDAGGTAVAVFTAVGESPITGTVWQLTGYNNGVGGVVSVAAGVETTAVFNEDGSLNGNGGCNNYFTSYTVDGQNLTITGPIGSTMMACDEAAMAQEAAFLAALPNAATFEIRGVSLEIRDADGALLASFVASIPASLSGVTWELTGYNNGLDAVVSTLAGVEVTAVFDEDGTLSGSGGCNRFSTSYTTDGSNIVISDAIASTMMACDEEIMQQETAFLATLPNAATYTIERDRLELRAADGALVASFVAQVPPPLTGATWMLTDININNGVTGAAGEATAVFSEDGYLSGFTGCNNYRTTFTQDGTALAISPEIISTRMACPEGALSEQEAAFLTVLPQTATYQISGGRLELRDANGALLAAFAPASVTELPGSSWLVTGYYVNQGVTSPAIGTELSIYFDPAGSVEGSAGCNRYFGSFQASDSNLTIGALATTRAFCPDPEGIMEQETAFVAALQSAATYSIQNNLLEIRSADGAIAVQAIPAEQ
jgi:heat shock protein HslJ